MKILVPAVSSAISPDGVSRHAVNLAMCLLEESEVTQVDLVVGAWQSGYVRSLIDAPDRRLRIHLARSQRSSVQRNLWYLKQLPGLARRFKSDVVHATYPVPIHRSRIGCPIVATLHDLYPYDVPANFGYPQVFFNRLILSQCLNAVDAISCVSESTLARLISCFPSHAAKASFVYNAVQPKFASDSIPSLQDQAFLLAIAQHRKNKNLPCTLAVFQRILSDHPNLLLVLVGNTGPETKRLLELIRLRIPNGRVMLLQGLSEPQLQWCYQRCALLLATSTHEGFGLPVAEAMLAGCPVVCSDIPAFRELGEGYCRLLPPRPDALTSGVRSALDAPRPEAVALPQLSLHVIAKQYMRLYRGLLAARARTVSSSPLWNDQKGDAQ